MATNFYFQPFPLEQITNEQLLVEDLVIEAMGIYGMDVYYLPRSSGGTEDMLYGEDTMKQYRSAHQIERFADELRQNVDEIAFSSGYPSKDITTISASQNGQLAFTGTVKDGKFLDGQARGKTVEEVLGKSMAKQIAEKESGVLKGDDLTIGGEGMKKYYDEIYPKFLDCLLFPHSSTITT